jgi:hypothetical protein
MRPRRALLATAFAALVLPLAGCGAEEEELDVAEGEPIHFEDVTYNVVISRFLNPDDPEDAEYLAEQPEPPPGEFYFGVFMRVENESDETVSLPDTFTVVDTLGNEYEPLEDDNPYALPLGAELPAGDEYPVPGSSPAEGPIEGSLVLFLVEEASTENRPLELEVPLASGETGTVELDI